MGYNKRKVSTLTRSVSFSIEVLAAVDLACESLNHMERSTFISHAMQHLLGIYPHPEVVGRDVPFVEMSEHDRVEMLRRAAEKRQ